MTARPAVVLVPGTMALLPEYAGGTDPVAELRAACLEAVAGLAGEVRVVASNRSGERVAQHLLRETDQARGGGDDPAYLVVGNGSAARTEKAPGHLDLRARAFDDGLRDALITPDTAALRAIDRGLAAALWADVDALVALGQLLVDESLVEVGYDDDPYGVQYWVLRWR